MTTVMDLHAAGYKQKHLTALSGNAEGTCLLFSDGSRKQTHQSLKEVLNDLCLRHGSTLKGRSEAFCSLLQVHQKPCILLSESSMEIMMPCVSLSHCDAEVILYNEICDLQDVHNGTCRVIFSGGLSLEVHASLRTIRLQMKRCEEFLERLHDADIHDMI